MVEIENLQRLRVGTLSRYLSRTEGEVLRYGSLYTDGKPCISFTYRAKEMVLQLRYSVEGQPYSYDIQVEEHSSNLGLEGKYYYFVCPSTSRRCRNLYLYNGYFVSRFAIPRVMYESQGYRSSLVKSFQTFFGGLDLVKRYGKERYRGRLTPYGKRLQKAYNRAISAKERLGGHTTHLD